MRRKILAIILALLLFVGCTPKVQQPKQYQATFLDAFDTVTTLLGYADSKAEFEQQSEQIHDNLMEYHRLFDIYHSYGGIQNLKTVNDNAGIAPVKVDERIIALLTDGKKYAKLTDGAVNVAMGSVLSLWHEARNAGMDFPESAKLPQQAQLLAAAEHIDPDCIVIDADASTVYLSDPDARLDVGAIAKGWAVEQVCRELPSGYALSVGGNVCVTGPKPDGNAWVIGIDNPNGGDYLHTLSIQAGCVVTSGDYQRYYTVNGKRYHHIIDPKTLYPSEHYRAVSVLCADSGLADALSTALFILPLEAGEQLLEASAAEAMWVLPDGSLRYSDGFEAYIKK